MNRYRTPAWKGLGGAACALLLAVAAPQAHAAEPKKVTIAIASSVLDASQASNTSVPIYTGCWKKAGYDVTIQTTNGSTAIQSLVTGQIDFAYMGTSNAVVAISRGAPIKGVYLNIRKNFQFPVVMESSPIKKVADFKGKTMGVASYGTPTVQVVKAMMAEAGLDPNKDVTIIETGFGGQAVTALTNGTVDIWGTWDSQAATAENMGVKLRRFSSPAADKLRLGAAYFVRNEYIESEPKVVGDILRCVAEGAVITQTNPAGVLRAHWEVYPATKRADVSEEKNFQNSLHILETRLNYLALEPGERWGESPVGAVDDMVAFMRSTGALTTDVDASKVFTNQFVEAINDFDTAAVKASASKLPAK